MVVSSAAKVPTTEEAKKALVTRLDALRRERPASPGDRFVWLIRLDRTLDAFLELQGRRG